MRDCVPKAVRMKMINSGVTAATFNHLTESGIRQRTFTTQPKRRRHLRKRVPAPSFDVLPHGVCCTYPVRHCAAAASFAFHECHLHDKINIIQREADQFRRPDTGVNNRRTAPSLTFSNVLPCKLQGAGSTARW